MFSSFDLRRVLLGVPSALALASGALLAGCASYSEPLSKSEAVTQEVAYVYGTFVKSKLPNFGLVLEEVSIKKKYTIQFRAEPGLQVIKLEPGIYAITEFIAANFANEVVGRKSLKETRLSRQFVASPGSATYLGDFAGTYDFDTSYFTWRIEEVVDREAEARSELVISFPAFRDLRLEKAPYL